MGPAPFSSGLRPTQSSRVTYHVDGLLPIKDENLMVYLDCEHKMDLGSLGQSIVIVMVRRNSVFLRAFEEAGRALRAEWTVLLVTEPALHNQYESACATLVEGSFRVRQNANEQLCGTRQGLTHVQEVIVQQAA
ncbi:hypothetical protein, unlikely [Trypanosoma congolense IL3000]|uniref:Uncharacterized protein n=1 Tax=Trypanosoma congolense (strain IL3000) TaxID=1068625 RepID=F9W7J1_TRYCI|nr:hypothetical protein, unlikely [Trypanosoma congolense IL3000]